MPNPYAPPRHLTGPAPTERPDAWLAPVFLLTWLLSLVLMIGAGVLGAYDDAGEPPPLAVGLSALGALCWFGHFILGLVWLHGSWASLPHGARVNRAGRRISPGEAVGLLFVPCFNVYWTFAANIGLAEALERLAERRQVLVSSPRTLATAAAIGQIVPYCGLLVAPPLWFAYMRSVDAALGELHAAGALRDD